MRPRPSVLNNVAICCFAAEFVCAITDTAIDAVVPPELKAGTALAEIADRSIPLIFVPKAEKSKPPARERDLRHAR